jgi:hypothetical protein
VSASDIRALERNVIDAQNFLAHIQVLLEHEPMDPALHRAHQEALLLLGRARSDLRIERHAFGLDLTPEVHQ